MIGMVTTITPRVLVGECVRRGFSKAKLMAEAGISQDYLDHPAGRIPVDLMCALWDTAVRTTRQEMLGLHSAVRVPFGMYRLLDYMLAASATPQDGLESTARAFRIMNTGLTLSFRSRSEEAYLEMHGPDKLRDLPRPYIEYILTLYLERLRITTQVHCKPLEVHVTYARTPSTQEYDRVFGARVRFCQAVSRLVFPRHLMALRHPSADPELCELLEVHAQQRLRRSSGDKHSFNEVRHALACNLMKGKAALTDLSAQLAMSVRSLQREISLNGMTFRALLDQTRQERAVALLQQQDLPLAEIATRLCYSDLSSFSRAFQRWTGRSPQQHRKNEA